jgi:hypothetical protein
VSSPDETAARVRYFFHKNEIRKLGIPKLGVMNFIPLRLVLFVCLWLGKIRRKKGSLEHEGMIGCHYGRSREIYKVILLMRRKNMSCIRYSLSLAILAVTVLQND